MKIFIRTVLAILIVLVLWINIERPIPINLNIFGYKIQTRIDVLTLNFNFNDEVIKRDFKTRLGLDLKGGSLLVYEVDNKSVKEEDLDDALLASRDVIEARVNMFGVSEPVVRIVKSGRVNKIQVELPGVTNIEEASSLIGQTAQLKFKEMGDKQVVDATLSAQLSYLNLTKETSLTGRDVEKATVVFDPQDATPQVSLTFSQEGGKKFAEITKRNLGQQVGIFIDDFILSAPVVQQEIVNGQAVISGSFTVDAAKQLANAINSGALPLTINLTQQRSIGPTLGALEVSRSMTAGIIGLLAVIIFMIGNYGKMGVIASISLIIYGIISITIFKIIPVVLTLPGIAGFILSIGMAVDSNILIFERIKEELRKGKPHNIALKIGFGRAIDAIKDANITTILVATILFNPLNWEFLPQFGLVRGFALTLAIGVLTSLFTGVFITKRLINFFIKKV